MADGGAPSLISEVNFFICIPVFLFAGGSLEKNSIRIRNISMINAIGVIGNALKRRKLEFPVFLFVLIMLVV